MSISLGTTLAIHITEDIPKVLNIEHDHVHG